MRTTIHMVSRREFWRYALGVRRARREWAARVAALPGEAELARRSNQLRAALAGGPLYVKELDGLAGGFIGNLGLWVDLVRVPPSGTWERRRADRLALAETGSGRPTRPMRRGSSTSCGRTCARSVPRRGGTSRAWAGIPVADAKRAGEGIDLARFEDEAGHELVDLPGPRCRTRRRRRRSRFLPHWDNSLLVHARRTGLVPEAHRPRIFSTKNPFSVGTVLVDGRVVAGWSVKQGRVVVDAYEELSTRDGRAVEREREALEAFHA